MITQLPIDHKCKESIGKAHRRGSFGRSFEPYYEDVEAIDPDTQRVRLFWLNSILEGLLIVHKLKVSPPVGPKEYRDTCIWFRYGGFEEDCEMLGYEPTWILRKFKESCKKDIVFRLSELL